MRKIDMIGKKFGRLTVLSETKKKSGHNKIWLCKCDCGKLVEVQGDSLRSGHTKSCGCLQKEIVTIHGDNRRGKISRLYEIWRSMKSRCLNPKHKAYKYYGGKGIKIYNEWKNDYVAFKSWALTNRYQDDLTIDRINNDGNYCPENCRWIPKSENSRNSHFKRWGKRRKKNE